MQVTSPLSLRLPTPSTTWTDTQMGDTASSSSRTKAIVNKVVLLCLARARSSQRPLTRFHIARHPVGQAIWSASAEAAAQGSPFARRLTSGEACQGRAVATPTISRIEPTASILAHGNGTRSVRCDDHSTPAEIRAKPNVVLKADYRNRSAEQGQIADEVNLGFGFAF